MRALRSVAAAALLAGSMASPLGGSHSRFDAGPGIPFGTLVDTQEDRRRRNLAAGGRAKRIARNKARRSLRAARTRSIVAGPREGRVFMSDKREAAFKAALAAGETRNNALKLARRLAA